MTLSPSFFKRSRIPKEPSPRERVLAQRERLLLCALQLLHEPQAALEVVLEALGHALRSPLLVQISGALPVAGAGGALPVVGAGGALPGVTSGDVRSLAGAGGSPAVSPPQRQPEAQTESEALTRWLDRLIVTLSLSRLRAGASAPTSVDGDEPPLAEVLRRPARSTESPRPAPAWPAADMHLVPRLSQHLARLSPEVRVTLSLAVMQGRTLCEVADLLGCSEATCRFWLMHGRKALRRALQHELSAESGPPEPRAPVPLGAAHDVRRGKKTAARA